MTKRLVFAATLLVAVRAAAAPSPNVVLIISDDHGWTDYGFMGHPRIRTPHLDRLASESLVITRGYVPSSLCRPSLASIMTGLYPHLHRITGNDPQGNARDAANRAAMVEVFRKSPTLLGRLGEKGYLSHQSGKWWEGECRCAGFTECMTHGDVARGGRHGDEGLKIGRETMRPIFDFLDSAGNRPFFLWYAPFLPHQPHNPPERLLGRYREAGHPLEIAKYYAMVEWLDETVGQLLGYLDAKGLARNTLVVYLADNGWVQTVEDRGLTPRRAKMSPYDAGVRTPILVRWPGRISPRREERVLASSIDIAPTVLAACGFEADPSMPGIDLADRRALARRDAIHGSIFVHTTVNLNQPASGLKYRWTIQDRWKLIVPYSPNAQLPIWGERVGAGWSREVELYDVLADPREETNLAPRQPDRVRSLRERLDRWWKVSE